MTELFITDIDDSTPLPDRIKLVGQTGDTLGSSVYEYFLSEQTRQIKDELSDRRKRGLPVGSLSKDYYSLRQHDLETALARFPEYEVRPPSFAGDISLYRKQ